MPLYQKWKIFSEFFFLHFLKLDSILNIFKQKMTLMSDVYVNVGTPKDVVR